MTQNKKFKKQVRQRMARTGESYAQARAEILKHPLAGDVTMQQPCHGQLIDGKCPECGYTSG